MFHSDSKSILLYNECLKVIIPWRQYFFYVRGILSEYKLVWVYVDNKYFQEIVIDSNRKDQWWISHVLLSRQNFIHLKWRFEHATTITWIEIFTTVLSCRQNLYYSLLTVSFQNARHPGFSDALKRNPFQ